MNRASMAKQIMETPMNGSKPKGMMMGGMVKPGYKAGGTVKMSKGGMTKMATGGMVKGSKSTKGCKTY